MEVQAMIHHRLDLALRLVDSVSGRVVEERDVRFSSKYLTKMPIYRGAGLYLFLNTEKEEHDIMVYVYGYEPQKFRITYLVEEEQLPIHNVYLHPLDNPVRNDILTLRGNLPGIKEIEAVSLMEANCCIKAFDVPRKIMTVFNQHKLSFHHIHYGLINLERTAYEHFEVEKEISSQEIQCKQKLEQSFQINQPIARVIFGKITEEGDYVLKVFNAKNAKYLVRFVVDGNVCFQNVDFHQKGNVLEYVATQERGV